MDLQSALAAGWRLSCLLVGVGSMGLLRQVAASWSNFDWAVVASGLLLVFRRLDDVFYQVWPHERHDGCDYSQAGESADQDQAEKAAKELGGVEQRAGEDLPEDVPHQV
jgi:hypothetical protein